jgi:hypothetical protein
LRVARHNNSITRITTISKLRTLLQDEQPRLLRNVDQFMRTKGGKFL